MSSAEYQRKWRASRGARTGAPGRPVTEPCGTVAAYRRHERHGEEVCDLCRAAHNAYHRDLYRRRLIPPTGTVRTRKASHDSEPRLDPF